MLLWLYQTQLFGEQHLSLSSRCSRVRDKHCGTLRTTRVEVAHAMVHGGPYPATTFSYTTSVGSNAVYRFTRAVCYQNSPQQLLPAELKNENPQHIWRQINGAYTNEAIV